MQVALTSTRPRFQPSRAAPSVPHQVPNEHAENAGTRKRRHPEEGPALDPLENAIRAKAVTQMREYGQSCRSAGSGPCSPRRPRARGGTVLFPLTNILGVWSRNEMARV